MPTNLLPANLSTITCTPQTLPILACLIPVAVKLACPSFSLGALTILGAILRGLPPLMDNDVEDYVMDQLRGDTSSMRLFRAAETAFEKVTTGTVVGAVCAAVGVTVVSTLGG